MCLVVHGNWAEWSSWGDCTVTCGGGQKRRFRTCSNPFPKNNGRPCIGSGQETDTCNSQRCAGSESSSLSDIITIIITVLNYYSQYVIWSLQRLILIIMEAVGLIEWLYIVLRRLQLMGSGDRGVNGRSVVGRATEESRSANASVDSLCSAASVVPATERTSESATFNHARVSLSTDRKVWIDRQSRKLFKMNFLRSK